MIDPTQIHRCAISVTPVSDTRYEIIYKHRVSDGRCLDCGEIVPRPLDLSRPVVKLDLGRPDA